MEQGGITKRLMRLAAVFVGHVKGGLAAVTVVASTLFGALCGVRGGRGGYSCCRFYHDSFYERRRICG